MLTIGRTGLRTLRAALVILLAVALSGVAPLRAAQAQPIVDAAKARAELQATLVRADVQAELTALGVSAEEASARVASLSDAEVLALHGKIAAQPAGQGFAEAVAGILLVTLLVFVITDLLGYTDVLPFINPLPRPAN
jgi:hypothetical protein